MDSGSNTETPSSSSLASSPGSSSSSSPPRRAATKGMGWTWLAAVGVFSYAWLGTNKLQGMPWWGPVGFLASAVLSPDVILGLGTLALDRLLPRRPPDGK